MTKKHVVRKDSEGRVIYERLQHQTYQLKDSHGDLVDINDETTHWLVYLEDESESYYLKHVDKRDGKKQFEEYTHEYPHEDFSGMTMNKETFLLEKWKRDGKETSLDFHGDRPFSKWDIIEQEIFKAVLTSKKEDHTINESKAEREAHRIGITVECFKECFDYIWSMPPEVVKPILKSYAVYLKKQGKQFGTVEDMHNNAMDSLFKLID